MNQQTDHIRTLLAQVTDPEIPVLSIVDLGILRGVTWRDEVLEVSITPTYSGCPAMEIIRAEIVLMLAKYGYDQVRVTQTLSPAWTTDWMTEQGKDKLKAYGIAPPSPRQMVCASTRFHEQEAICCPRCNSYDTHLISQFGSTPCKALYRCNHCREPFDYFKCH
jgi:ring-1,2-phenylacetyl-CoA epoxidase subunit PaaD